MSQNEHAFRDDARGNDAHVDAERLALLAMGESVLSPDETAHLAGCAICADEVAALRHAAQAGRASFDIGALESPPERVWARIRADVGLTDTAAMDPVGRPAARHRRRMRWQGWALAAAVVLVAAVGLGSWAIGQRTQAPTEVAAASLAAFPEHGGAEGSATVRERPDGSMSLDVTLSADAATDAYREVWLITADASALVSLGVLDGTSASFAVPRGVDLRDYVLVDISDEPVDGDPTHSGDSIVRGELTFL